jgi:hypothetical protein
MQRGLIYFDVAVNGMFISTSDYLLLAEKKQLAFSYSSLTLQSC